MINGLTDNGLLRERNEDSFFFTSERGKFIIAVSDGMGGHNAGDVASKIAVETVKDFCKNNNIYEDTEKKIRLVIREINEKIYAYSRLKKEMQGMGATVVMAVGKGKEVTVGNIGDSRAYKADSEGIYQITEDHSYVNELLKNNMITEEEARVHPKRNEILKAVGIAGEVFPDIFNITLNKGENLLLCTDGLTNMVTDSEIHSILCIEKENDEILKMLIDTANKNGGTDNITAVLLKK